MSPEHETKDHMEGVDLQPATWAGQVWAVFFGSTIFQSTLYLGGLILGSDPSSLMSVALQWVTSTVSLAPADC